VTTPGIGASGIMGVALEVTSGTYLAPTKFVPFTAESLQWQQDTNWRRPIRNTPGLVGASPGNGHVEGDISIEALSDVLPYFLMATRATVAKTGAAPYTYTATPSAIAVPQKTLSITIVRNGVTFGYTGVTIGDWHLTIDNSTLMFTCSALGTAEASQSTPTGIVWPTSVPFGAGNYTYQIPTATQVFDADTFDFESNDNPTVQFRLKNALGAQFVSFGESEATIKTDRDFTSRAEYDAWKTLTAKSITFVASKGASESITITAPVAVVDTYEVAIGGQGDLVRASITYQCAIDGTGKHYQVIVVTPTENVV
jgi:hypothetical protein